MMRISYNHDEKCDTIYDSIKNVFDKAIECFCKCSFYFSDCSNHKDCENLAHSNVNSVLFTNCTMQIPFSTDPDPKAIVSCQSDSGLQVIGTCVY